MRCHFDITQTVYSDAWTMLKSSSCPIQHTDGWVMVSLKHIGNVVGKILALIICAIVALATPLFAAFDVGHSLFCSGKGEDSFSASSSGQK